MKAHENWKKCEEHDDQDLTALIDIRKITSASSNAPLQKIKRNLIINSIWGILIVLSYLIIMIKFPLWQVQLCLGIVMSLTIWGIYSAIQLYRNISNNILTNSVLLEMERHYCSIRQWISLQQNVGLLIYPVSAAGGFMLGVYLGSGKPIEEFMEKPLMIVILLVMIAILVPICYQLAKWMGKKSFGQYADQLKYNIDSLKSGI